MTTARAHVLPALFALSSAACGLSPFASDDATDTVHVGLDDAAVGRDAASDAAVASADAAFTNDNSCEYDGGRVPLGVLDAGACQLCACAPPSGVLCVPRLCAQTCEVDGSTYDVGSTVGNNCETCVCNADGTLSCMRLCGDVCTFADTSYTAGGTRPCADGCNTCTCGSDGQWSSTKIACPQLPKLTVCDFADYVASVHAEPLYLEGNAFALQLQHTGGCLDHTYTLCTDATLTPSQIVPNEAHARAWVVDSAPQDTCLGDIMAQRVFDVATLAPMYGALLGAGEGGVTLAVEGAQSSARPRYEVR